MTTAASAPQASAAPFGTIFAEQMAVATWSDGEWSDPRLGPVEPFAFHPATHALHYGSACFEGLKAHRGLDGVVRIFRLDSHVERMRTSARLLHLPQPPAEVLAGMISDTVAANRDEVPETPGSLYIRPTLVGTEPNVGAAAAPSKTALLYILTSPVGDYFSGGVRPLKLKIETDQPRTTPGFGMVKSGANYVMALGITLDAKADLGIDQVLFAPGGAVQETGASNFMLIDGERILTPALTESFLHGVTRDSILTLARDIGFRVEERDLGVDEVVAWAGRPEGEAALSGTAAVLSGVGRLFYDGREVVVGSGEVGPNTTRLRQALTDIHVAAVPDPHRWTTPV